MGVSQSQCLRPTSLCGLCGLEELILEVWQEGGDAVPGEPPQLGVLVPAHVEDPCRVHHQQHVLQRLRNGLRLVVGGIVEGITSITCHWIKIK